MVRKKSKSSKKVHHSRRATDKGWIGEVARDIIALGGLPFFILVLVRIHLLSNPVYFYQFLIAGVLFVFFGLLVKASIYSGLGLIVAFFTLNYYQSNGFTAMAIITYCLLLVSLDYLGKKRSWILLGSAFGAISTAISFYAVDIFFKTFL